MRRSVRESDLGNTAVEIRLCRAKLSCGDHKPASAPRGRSTLCDTISPSERSHCNHCFVVDSGTPSATVIFLLPMPAPAIFSMAKSSSAERTMMHAKIPVNTWDLRQVRLWCMDWCHESVMCVDVQCVFVKFYIKIEDFHVVVFWAPFSILQFFTKRSL